MSIPVLKPSITDAEIAAVTEVLRSGWLGLGPKTAQFEVEFAQKIGTKFCIGLNSGTAALHLALAALQLKSDQEVIVTPMTFVSTVHAILYCGAKPVFADILPDTLNINPTDVAAKVTPKTRAIVGVDMAGHPADWDELLAISNQHGLAVIEDAAHSCGAFYKNNPVGSLVPVTCFSFHAVKNLTCGEGGAISCDSDWKDRWFREMRWLGISKDTWSRTEGDTSYHWKYWVQNIGFKCHMNDLAAAIGLVQLQRLDDLNERRRHLAQRYQQSLAGLDWLTLPTERSYVKSSWHLYQVKLPDESTRDRMVGHLIANGISPGVHYIPSHLHPCYQGVKAVCPVAGHVWKKILSLPLFPDLTEEDQEIVINAVKNFVP